MKKRIKKAPFAGKPKRPTRIKWHSDVPVLREIFSDPEEGQRSTGAIIAKFAYWIDHRHHSDPALIAVAEADRTGSVDPLIDFFASDEKLTAFGRARIANYLERHKRGKRGRKATPDYDLTDAENRIDIAKAALRDYLQSGMTGNEALDATEREVGVPTTVLLAALDSKHASERRQRKREAALKSR